MNIVLGIYSNGYFRSVVNESTFNCSYPFTELIYDYWVDSEGIINTVLEASIKCNKIIFLIDGLLPNISGREHSYTCQELITILSCSLIPLSKIEFRDNNEIVTSDYVMNKLNLSKELFIK